MDVLPLGLQQALAGCVLNQSMFETIASVRWCATPEDQLRVEQLGQCVPERGVGSEMTLP